MDRAYFYIGTLNINDGDLWTVEAFEPEQQGRKVTWAGDGSPTQEGRRPITNMPQNKVYNIKLTCHPQYSTNRSTSYVQNQRDVLFAQLKRVENPGDSLYISCKPPADETWTEIRTIKVLAIDYDGPYDLKAWAATVITLTLRCECEAAWRGTAETLEALVNNGSFEVDSNNDQLADCWTNVGGANTSYELSTTAVAFGKYSQKIVAKAAGGDMGILSDPIPVDASAEYTISAYVYHNGDGAGGSGSPVQLRIFDLSHSYDHLTGATYIEWTANWQSQEKSTTITMPAGTTWIQIQVLRPVDAGNEAKTIWWIDGLFVYKGSAKPVARLFQHIQQLAPDVMSYENLQNRLWSTFSIHDVPGDIDPQFNIRIRNLTAKVFKNAFVSIIREPTTLTYVPLAPVYDIEGGPSTIADAQSICNLINGTSITAQGAYGCLGSFKVTTTSTQRIYWAFAKLKSTVNGNFNIKAQTSFGIVIPEKTVFLTTNQQLVSLGLMEWPLHKQDQILSTNLSNITITLWAQATDTSASVYVDYIVFLPAEGHFALSETTDTWISTYDEDVQVGNMTYGYHIPSGYQFALQPPELKGEPVLHPGDSVGYLWLEAQSYDADPATHGADTSTYDKRYRLRIIVRPRYS